LGVAGCLASTGSAMAAEKTTTAPATINLFIDRSCRKNSRRLV
jgi:hypothetical protein